MPRPLYIVDAFTDRPFSGNPAAVCLLEGLRWPEAHWMQRVAAEMNLSETAFVLPQAGPGARAFGLRWFTPGAEVELCGHATLAGAYVLWALRRVSAEQGIHFATRWRGTLTCRPARAAEVAGVAGATEAANAYVAEAGADAPGAVEAVAMALPMQRCAARRMPEGLAAALGVGPEAIVASSFGPDDWIIELDGARRVAELAPDFQGLGAFECRGVAVAAAAGAEAYDADFISRLFAPRLRIAEDPVTGSLHGVLGPYWSERLGKAQLRAHQASPRGG